MRLPLLPGQGQGAFRPELLTAWILRAFICAITARAGIASADTQSPQNLVITNAAGLRHLAAKREVVHCAIQLAGTVLWVSPTQDQIALQDDSGGVLLKVNPRSLPMTIAPAQRVSIAGDCEVGQGQAGAIGLVNNDGHHPAAELSGQVYLSAGLHPIEVDWFNRAGEFFLNVQCQMPGQGRSSMPDSVLFHEEADPATGTRHLTPGLDYRAYEGMWEALPDFPMLPILKRGAIHNFDISVRPRDPAVGIVFTGYFQAPRDGSYRFWIKSDDGSRLYLEDHPLAVAVLGSGEMPEPQPVSPGQLMRQEQEDRWSEMEGVITSIRGPSQSPDVELTSGTGRAYLKIMEPGAGSMDQLLRNRVKVTGIYQSALTVDGQKVPSLLVPGLANFSVVETASGQMAPQDPAASKKLPTLTTAIQVMNLGRKEAMRGYPVELQGVVTARTGTGFFIQDSTWSTYIGMRQPLITRVAEVGECWQIEGSSTAAFAPSVWLKRGTCLGPGIMPPPIRPSWDELTTGSFSTKYLEIHGVVTSVQTNTLVLLTRSGKLPVSCADWEPDALTNLQDALIRVCGVGSSERDEHDRIRQGLRLYSASITVDKPAPPDPFDTPLKHANDLFFFDAHADVLSRVRLSGQVTGEYGCEYFLIDGANGFRFHPKSPVHLPVGTFVQVVGFPDRNGPSPVLRDALVRTTGRADLPMPATLAEKTLLDARLDATRVRVKSRLAGLTLDGTEQVLDLQLGNRSYVARLLNRSGYLPELAAGSDLELTGVYMGQRVDRTVSRDIDSFDLLLNSPSDVLVLATPSWWTVRHAAMVMGAMMSVLIASLVWISLLRRQVEDRTAQLTAEIKNREQAEHERALEEERARIARDLHDDLGATLTEIRFLSAVESGASIVPKDTRSQLRKVSEKAHQLVSSLDEIVWAVNPAHDSVPSLASYLRHVAEELFRSTPARCRMDIDDSLPAVPLSSEVRHNLYLCIREALHNAAKHAGASEVWLRIHWREHSLHISVEDSGCGFDLTMRFKGNGLPNMRRRLEKIGGRFECDSRPGAGTHCRISMPLN